MFNGYLAGGAFLLSALMTLTPQSMSLLLLAELALFVYAVIVLPYKVLPVLYPLSRRRVFVAQIGAFIGASALLLVGMGIVIAIAQAVKAGIAG